MYSLLKPLAALSEEEIGLVALPFFAVSHLKGSWQGCDFLRGYTAALAACMDHHDSPWEQKQRAFERLRRQVEEAVLVVLEEQPLSAAYYQVDGQWQVTRQVWNIFARTRLEQQLQHIQHHKHQQALRQTQRVTASAFIIEDISEAERRTITLGPHEEPGYQPRSDSPPAVYTGPPDEGIEPIFSPMDVVDAMLEGTAVAGIRDYLPSRRNVVKQIKPGVQSEVLAREGIVTKGIEAKNGLKIEGFTKHGVDRAIGNGSDRAGVSPQGILDALKNPLKIGDVKTDQLGRQSQRFVGQTGEVVVNPQTGRIISVNPTSTKKADRLIKQLENSQ